MVQLILGLTTPMVTTKRYFKYTPLKVQKWDIEETENNIIKRSYTLHAKASLLVLLVLVVVLLIVIPICLLIPRRTVTWLPHFESDSRLGRYERAAISTDAAPCAPIGKDILLRNGSAVDAAIAVLLCMGVVNPQSCGLGGGFLMLYYNREQEKMYYIDSRETAPAAATKDMFNGNATISKYGGLAIAVPGELAGYKEAHSQFGTIPWKDLFTPTIRMCREGLRVNAHLERALRKSEYPLRYFEHISRLFVDNKTNQLLKEGDIYRREDLARTLESIAEQGTRALYGPSKLATQFLQDLKVAGSLITESDLQGFAPRQPPAVRVGLRGNQTLWGVPPPGSGALIALILHVMDGYDDLKPDVTNSREHTVRMLHRIIETFKFAYAQRVYMEDDDGSNYMKELVERLTSRQYANYIRDQIDDGMTYDDPEHYGLNTAMTEDHGTAHMSVVVPNGDAVSVTSTVNLYFGSMILSPSTGIILNNEMDDFSSPDITNYFGLPPTGRNHIKPGRKPFSSMSPAIVTDAQGNVTLNVGGNGGTQITTSVAQTILRNLYLKENIKKAIDAPRFHHQLLPNVLDHEPNFPKDLLADLSRKGHKLKELGEKMLGIMMGIERGEDGFLYANSDYRKGGEVDGF